MRLACILQLCGSVGQHRPTMSNTQILHDRVNLIRLVSRLEEDVANRQDWGSSGLSAWVKATNAAQVGWGNYDAMTRC